MARRKLNIEELPGNSIDGEDTTVERVTKGAVVQKRGRQSATFASDVRSILLSLYDEVVLPAVKTNVTDFFTRGIEMLIWPEGHGRQPSRGGRSNYRSMYTARSSSRGSTRQVRKVPTHSKRRTYTVDDIMFQSRGDADRVVAGLMERIAVYEWATVGDLYSLTGLTSSHIDESYGWDDISSVVVRPSPDGYYLELPDPIYNN